MKKEFLVPVFALALICLIVSAALAVGQLLTGPIIAAAANERAEQARMEIIPSAASFDMLEIANLPKKVAEVYAASNGAGYIFIIHTSGYGGQIEIMCGIDNDGKIIKTTTLNHSETKGFGTLVFAMEGEYSGKDKNLAGIDAVTGATITSNAYISGIRAAFEAYELVKEAGK